MKLTTHLNPVLRLRLSGAFPWMSTWQAEGQPHFGVLFVNCTYLFSLFVLQRSYICICVFFFVEKCCNLHDGFSDHKNAYVFTYLFLRHGFHNGFICG